MRKYESYKCEICGNVVEIQKVGGGQLVCCNKPMVCITEKLTPILLMKAFAGESQARNKYDFFASKAKKEGYEYIADVFAKTALNEKEHAKMEYKFYNLLSSNEEIHNTADNLIIAYEGETYEHSEMYPEFAKVASEEGYNDIAKFFQIVAGIEKHHDQRYRKLHEMIINDKVFKSDDPQTHWICRNCGYIHIGQEVLEKCPSCKHPKSFFERLCEI